MLVAIPLQFGMKSTPDALAVPRDLTGMPQLRPAIAHVLPPSLTPEPENVLSALMTNPSGTAAPVLPALPELTTMLNPRLAPSAPKVLSIMLEKEPALLHDHSSRFLII